MQYSLPLKSTLEVAYVGNRGYDEFAENAGNQVPFGLDGSVAGKPALSAVVRNHGGLAGRAQLV